jgi:ATP-binding cassette, subfamily B, multidrug efflux pump
MERKNRPDNLPKTLIRLFSYLKDIWPWIILVIILALYSGITETLATRLAGNVTDNIIANIHLDSVTRLQSLLSDLVPIIIICVLGFLSAFIYNEIMVVATQRVLYKVRTELMDKMQKLPMSYFDKHTHGEIMSYFTNDVDSIVNALNDSFSNVFYSAVKIVSTILTLFLINVYLTLIVLVFIVIMFIFMYFNTKASKRYFRLQQKSLSSVNSVVEEDVSGVKVIKAFSHEEQSFEKFTKANDEWRLSSEKAFFHTQVNVPFFVSLSYFNFAISSICGVLALCTGWAGPLTFGQLQSYLVLTRNACQPFNFFTQHLNNFMVAAAGAERIFHFLDEEPEKDDGRITLEKISENEDFSNRYCWKIPKADGSFERKPLKGAIRFENVHFSYVKGKEILKGISFETHPGKKSAFVGSTGAGKTTIISLLARFYPLDSGSIYYDDINIEDIQLESLRRAISMVTQDTHLFTGTIKDNIRYVRLHSTDEEVIEAAKMSHAHSFIKRLPQGYDTMLYDDGGNLSAGQRQLLGLARASLNRPPVMILDEATSNIDTRSEMLIQKGLAELEKDRTVMIIAHRLSTIRDADEIMVLDKGKIIERGTQDELLALRGAYYDLYTGKVELD